MLPQNPDRASVTIFLILNYVKNQTSAKVQRPGLCLLVPFLGEPGLLSQKLLFGKAGGVQHPPSLRCLTLWYPTGQQLKDVLVLLSCKEIHREVTVLV